MMDEEMNKLLASQLGAMTALHDTDQILGGKIEAITEVISTLIDTVNQHTAAIEVLIHNHEDEEVKVVH
jgi:hypothetical protein